MSNGIIKMYQDIGCNIIGLHCSARDINLIKTNGLKKLKEKQREFNFIKQRLLN